MQRIAVIAGTLACLALVPSAALAAKPSPAPSGGATLTGTPGPTGGSTLSAKPAKATKKKATKSKSAPVKTTTTPTTTTTTPTPPPTTTTTTSGTPTTTPVSTGTSGQVSGTLIAVDGSSFTIELPGRQMSVLDALTAAADAVTADDYPYVWAGGHPEAGIANSAAKVKGRKAGPVGFDCSGAVAAVLAGGGLWTIGSGVPADNGVIAELLSDKLIARGAGQGTDEVTLYDDPGVHIFMNIDGRFFGTSDGGGGNAAQPNDGAGWLDDSAPDATDKVFKQYHILPAVLAETTTYGQLLTIKSGPGATTLDALAAGDTVRVAYTAAKSGTETATAVKFVSAPTASVAPTQRRSR